MKGLPSCVESERAVIGTLLKTPSAIADLSLKSEYFFDPNNKAVVDTILLLLGENIPSDIRLVYTKLKEQGKIDDFETFKVYLDYNVRPEFIAHYYAEVKKYWELRTIAEACDAANIAVRSVTTTNSANEALAFIDSTFLSLSNDSEKNDLVFVADSAGEVLKELEDLYNGDGKICGVESGFTEIDKITSGFQASDLIILAARPAMGKTALALNIAHHVAFNLKKTVAFFSLEMSRKQLMKRIISSSTKIDSNKLRNGKFNQEELGKICGVMPLFANSRCLAIDETASLSTLDFASRCRRLKRKNKKLDLIIVDYLQLMTISNFSLKQNREREISMISMSLKALAKELDCPVIALSQLNRSLESREDKRPRPSDLRESGSIEQDADQIMFVYRDEVYNKDSLDKGTAEIIFGKNRHGAIDTVKLGFDASFTRFFNL
jgi:replicative DNA helicase